VAQFCDHKDKQQEVANLPVSSEIWYQEGVGEQNVADLTAIFRALPLLSLSVVLRIKRTRTTRFEAPTRVIRCLLADHPSSTFFLIRRTTDSDSSATGNGNSRKSQQHSVPPTPLVPDFRGEQEDSQTSAVCPL